eukprot:GHVN01010198.1.p1 GENE.GHVN01010198.1~~GHVN01010198.1.p1  ORF type:complete len:364 (-),score=35.37 GHVN01010198.1:300-1391(-)
MPLFRRKRSPTKAAPIPPSDLSGGQNYDQLADVTLLISNRRPKISTSTMKDALVCLNVVEEGHLTTKEGVSIVPWKKERADHSADAYFLSSDAERLLDVLAKCVFVFVMAMVCLCLILSFIVAFTEHPLEVSLYFDEAPPNTVEPKMYVGVEGDIQWNVAFKLNMRMLNDNFFPTALRTAQFKLDYIPDTVCADGALEVEPPPVIDNPCASKCLSLDPFASTAMSGLGEMRHPPISAMSLQPSNVSCPVWDWLIPRQSNAAFSCNVCGGNTTTEAVLDVVQRVCIAAPEAQLLLAKCETESTDAYLNVTLLTLGKFRWLLSTFTPQSEWVLVRLPCNVEYLVDTPEPCSQPLVTPTFRTSPSI